jgi:hypothetical protein
MGLGLYPGSCLFRLGRDVGSSLLPQYSKGCFFRECDAIVRLPAKARACHSAGPDVEFLPCLNLWPQCRQKETRDGREPTGH